MYTLQSQPDMSASLPAYWEPQRLWRQWTYCSSAGILYFTIFVKSEKLKILTQTWFWMFFYLVSLILYLAIPARWQLWGCSYQCAFPDPKLWVICLFWKWAPASHMAPISWTFPDSKHSAGLTNWSSLCAHFGAQFFSKEGGVQSLDGLF